MPFDTGDITGDDIAAAYVNSASVSVDAAQAASDTSGPTSWLPGDSADYKKLGSAALDELHKMALTGITRWVDNSTGQKDVSGNTSPGTTAAANGATVKMAAASAAKEPAQKPGGMNQKTMLMIGGGVLALIVLLKVMK